MSMARSVSAVTVEIWWRWRVKRNQRHLSTCTTYEALQSSFLTLNNIHMISQGIWSQICGICINGLREEIARPRQVSGTHFLLTFLDEERSRSTALLE